MLRQNFWNLHKVQNPKLVPERGLEPPRLAAIDPKSIVYTISPLGLLCNALSYGSLTVIELTDFKLRSYDKRVMFPSSAIAARYEST